MTTPITRKKAPKVTVEFHDYKGMRASHEFPGHLDEQATQFAYRWAKRHRCVAYVFIGNEIVASFDGLRISELAVPPPPSPPVVDGVALQRQVAQARHALLQSKPKRRIRKHADQAR